MRCRPLSVKEKAKQSQKSVKILDEKVVIIQDVSAAKPEEVTSSSISIINDEFLIYLHVHI